MWRASYAGAASKGSRPARSALNAPEYVAVFEALMAWIDQGAKPNAGSVAALCEAARSRYAGACLFDEQYRPATGRLKGPTR
ncbi:hypothetical protein D3C86_1867170 [compost metagenome]